MAYMGCLQTTDEVSALGKALVTRAGALKVPASGSNLASELELLMNWSSIQQVVDSLGGCAWK